LDTIDRIRRFPTELNTFQKFKLIGKLKIPKAVDITIARENSFKIDDFLKAGMSIINIYSIGIRTWKELQEFGIRKRHIGNKSGKMQFEDKTCVIIPLHLMYLMYYLTVKDISGAPIDMNVQDLIDINIGAEELENMGLTVNDLIVMGLKRPHFKSFYSESGYSLDDWIGLGLTKIDLKRLGITPDDMKECGWLKSDVIEKLSLESEDINSFGLNSPVKTKKKSSGAASNPRKEPTAPIKIKQIKPKNDSVPNSIKKVSVLNVSESDATKEALRQFFEDSI
jgi:hypothetical protein